MKEAEELGRTHNNKIGYIHKVDEKRKNTRETKNGNGNATSSKGTQFDRARLVTDF